jgi:putative ABC transport system substrate-binding protein
MWSSAIAWIMTLTLSLLTTPLAAEAQPAGTRRIGLLETSSPSPARLQLWETLRQRLRELGYVEGQNIAFASRFGEGQPDQLPGLVAELVGLQVDVLVTAGTPATQAAQQATRTIPIVMTMVADPVGTGLVASLGHPGGNVTGLTNQDADLGGKRLELLQQVVPRDARLALLIDETNPGTVRIAQGTQAAAGALGVPLQSLGVRDPGELERTFAAMQEARASALIVEPRPLGSVPPRGDLRGQDSQGREAGRSARGAADEVRARHQSQDRQGPWPDNPPDAPLPGG